MASNLSAPISVVGTVANPFETEESDAQNPEGGAIPSRKPLSLWPGMYHSPVTAALWETRSRIFENLLDPPLNAPPQTQFLTKTPSQSRTSVLYNFSTDYILREQYRDPWNEVRIGKLLEDLDALAGTISVKVLISTSLPPLFSLLFPTFLSDFPAHLLCLFVCLWEFGISTVLMMIPQPGPFCSSLLPWTRWSSGSPSASTLISICLVLSSGLDVLPLKFSLKSLNRPKV